MIPLTENWLLPHRSRYLTHAAVFLLIFDVKNDKLSGEASQCNPIYQNVKIPVLYFEFLRSLAAGLAGLDYVAA